MSDLKIDRRFGSVSGFTIVELLIATAATLLIMGALTRAFGLVGNSIRDSRAEVTLSGESRDLMYGLRAELANLTASTDPADPDAGEGYFLYHEGPMADSTTTVFHSTGPVVHSAGYFPLSRWGDTDDYLAFTVKAPKDAPFRGVVPWGVVEARRRIDMAASWVAPTGYNPNQPKVISSQFAEVVYFMAPRMARNAAGALIYEADDGDNTDGMLETNTPQYVDLVDYEEDATLGDDFPDEFVLYRRVLLIRPDLNVTQRELIDGSFGFANFPAAPAAGVPAALNSDQPVLGFLRADGNIEPCGASVPAYSPGLWDPGGGNATSATPNWMLGMGVVQQSLDLSVARNLMRTTAGVQSGRPSQYYSASTIEQLRQPHRRFAHVMAPSSVYYTASMPAGFQGCSMPILALSPPTKFLCRGPTAPSTATTSVHPTRIVPGAARADHFTMNGHLRPEFILGGLREGEDIVSTSALAFDVKAFDPAAPIFIAQGVDGAPGIAGADDDGDGTNDDAGELGAMHSDDQVVTPNDPAFYTVVRSGPGVASPVSRGTYVDLGYVQQAGGNTRFRLGVDNIQVAYYPLLSSPFSGVTLFNTPDADIAVGMTRSGKLILGNGDASFATGIRGFGQFTYDSWTNAYEHDGINQYFTNAAPLNNNGFNGSDEQYTFWLFNGVPNPTVPPTPAPNGDVADPAGSQGFVNGLANRDTLPPINVPLKSLKISFRNYDDGTRQIDQLEIVKDFN